MKEFRIPTPDELAKEFRLRTDGATLTLLKKCVETLHREFVPGKAVQVDLGGVPEQAIAAVRQKLHDKGWIASNQYDHRGEGHWLEIKPLSGARDPLK